MNRIVLDPASLAKLNGLSEGGEFCDASGMVVGYFVPATDPSLYEVVDPPTDEELDRVEGEEGGRELREIINDIETTS